MNQNNRNAINIHQQILLQPVGLVRSQSKEPVWTKNSGSQDWKQRAAKMKEQEESLSELIIDDRLDGILDGIDDFSHIMVIYWAHLIPEERRHLIRVHPLGNKDFPLIGVFATHSPARPNSILVTVVRLIKREQNILHVTGLDALDGSPILDIKPYMQYENYTEIRIPDWMQEINQEFSENSV